MPCRNAAPWLEEAVCSALGQTWPRIEVIVVDDGSTDNSLEVAHRLASPRCRVVQLPHGGASAARNHALRLAQGDVIQYLDSDDYLAPDKIERQMRAMRECDSRRLTFGSVFHLLDGFHGGRMKFEPARSVSEKGADFLLDLWGAVRPPRMIAVHQWLAPRALIEAAGPWNERLSVDDDGEFFARVLLTSSGLTAVPGAFCYYRKGHSSMRQSTAFDRSRGHLRSGIEAACLKAGHLLAKCEDASAAGRTASRLVTQQIVDSYPHPLHRIGLEFLNRHHLSMAPEVDAPPWFGCVKPLLGWRRTRLLQDHARVWRRRWKAVAY